jgi:hypothetical protein
MALWWETRIGTEQDKFPRDIPVSTPIHQTLPASVTVQGTGVMYEAMCLIYIWEVHGSNTGQYRLFEGFLAVYFSPSKHTKRQYFV